MSYTNDAQLELVGTGAADWDTSINANMAILDRGVHVVVPVGTTVGSGEVCCVASGGVAMRWDVRSATNVPTLMSYKAVASGELAHLLAVGVVRSMDVWSSWIAPGQPVYVAVDSPGFCVASYAGHPESIGLALDHTSILFRPGFPAAFPELLTAATSPGVTVVGTHADFALLLGNRGIVRDLVVVSSHDRFKVQFWSGSSRVGSELVYETLTRSLATNSGDVGSTYFRDAAGFFYQGTDASTPYFVYGRITPQTGSSVTSGAFGVTIVAERFR
jgi:hypothetical protein